MSTRSRLTVPFVSSSLPSSSSPPTSAGKSFCMIGSMRANNSGLIAILMIPPANIKLIPAAGNSPNVVPRPAKINENSPTCDKETPTVNAVMWDRPLKRTQIMAVMLLQNTITNTTAKTCKGCSMRILGSKSIPTPKKKSTEKAS